MDFFPDDDEDSALTVVPSRPSTRDAASIVVKSGLAGVGGGRGVFASRDVSPGTLLLAEIPWHSWPDASSLDDPAVLLRALEDICVFPEALEGAKSLHPTSLDLADEEDRARIATLWSDEEIQPLLASSGLPKQDVLRSALALQHNGFVSGLYTRLTLVNHSCRPNCIKFSPSSGTGWSSEIWSTRAIKEGEEITICYCVPPEMSSLAMREYLQTHHRFACACSSCSSSGTPDGVVSEEQASMEAMHAEVEQMERELQFQAIEEPSDVVKTTRKMLSVGAKMVSTIRKEGCLQSHQLRDRCGLLVRVHKLCASAAATALETIQAVNNSSSKKKIKGALLVSAAQAYLENSLQLRERQIELLGNDHPDLAGTNLDIDQAFSCVQQLQSAAVSDPSVAGIIPSLPFPWAQSAVQARQEWRSCKEEGLRLKRLYSRHPRYSAVVSALKTSGDAYLPSADV